MKRIDKFISECGLATRKETAQLAKRGQISVNGEVVKDSSKHIDPEHDSVTFMGNVIEYRKFTYVMLNKPKGYVSATEDSRFPPVTDLLPKELRKMELFPVGRLDKDTEGLMILTNDGKLAHALLSPKKHVSKVYYFVAKLPLPKEAVRAFEEGIVLADGYVCKSAKLVLEDTGDRGYITLTEGKYHQIKRMVASFSNKVVELSRVEFATIPLDRGLKLGEWRYLTDSEIALLKSRIG